MDFFCGGGPPLSFPFSFSVCMRSWNWNVFFFFVSYVAILFQYFSRGLTLGHVLPFLFPFLCRDTKEDRQPPSFFTPPLSFLFPAELRQAPPFSSTKRGKPPFRQLFARMKQAFFFFPQKVAPFCYFPDLQFFFTKGEKQYFFLPEDVVKVSFSSFTNLSILFSPDE